MMLQLFKETSTPQQNLAINMAIIINLLLTLTHMLPVEKDMDARLYQLLRIRMDIILTGRETMYFIIKCYTLISQKNVSSHRPTWITIITLQILESTKC
jgi:uncharacterized membrane protein YozB (DUF420 family)